MSLFVQLDLSNLALDRIVWNETETDENTSCPMIDWTSQNWTKRDWRNNQQQEHQQKQQQEKKRCIRLQQRWQSKIFTFSTTVL